MNSLAYVSVAQKAKDGEREMGSLTSKQRWLTRYFSYLLFFSTILARRDAVSNILSQAVNTQEPICISGRLLIAAFIFVYLLQEKLKTKNKHYCYYYYYYYLRAHISSRLSVSVFGIIVVVFMVYFLPFWCC